MEAARERAKKRMAEAMSEPEAINNAKSQNLGSTSSNPPAPVQSSAIPAAAPGKAPAQPVPPAPLSSAPQAIAAPQFLCDDDMVKHVLVSNLVQLKALAAELQIVGSDSMTAHLIKAAIIRVCGSADAFTIDSDTKEFTITSITPQHFGQPTAASGQSA